MLKSLRTNLKEEGRKIPKFGGTTKTGEQLYGVFLGDECYEVQSCCAIYARFMAISEWVGKLEKEEERARKAHK
ncbi:hypothetical protein [Vibrio owensii]|uniref:hypothetical protein n=1 Tax=Vibrio harveyi group TaxID=717610 RepID=UPI003CC682A9